MEIDLPKESFALHGYPVDTAFEKLYLEIRKKEQRIYPDEQVALLPDISQSHIHYKEWQLRKISAGRLLGYLKKKNKPLKILEVGCGNGWLSAKLADIEKTTVVALDINHVELKQGASVFGNKTNLYFEYGDIRDEAFAKREFDIIIFAASLQYFPSLARILRAAVGLLALKGEVHILDTPLYKDDEIERARQRTKNYYALAGFPEMGVFYYHHPFGGLKHFKHRIMYNPFSALNKLFRKISPFYWVCIDQST